VSSSATQTKLRGAPAVNERFVVDDDAGGDQDGFAGAVDCFVAALLALTKRAFI